MDLEDAKIETSIKMLQWTFKVSLMRQNVLFRLILSEKVGYLEAV